MCLWGDLRLGAMCRDPTLNQGRSDLYAAQRERSHGGRQRLQHILMSAAGCDVRGP